MKTLRRQLLQAATLLIGERKREGVHPGEIIAELERTHGARYDRRRDPYRLTVHGVTATCTWSPHAGLIENWTRTATVRLMTDRAEAGQ